LLHLSFLLAPKRIERCGWPLQVLHGCSLCQSWHQRPLGPPARSQFDQYPRRTRTCRGNQCKEVRCVRNLGT
jgi:hypothetical protein